MLVVSNRIPLPRRWLFCFAGFITRGCVLEQRFGDIAAVWHTLNKLGGCEPLLTRFGKKGSYERAKRREGHRLCLCFRLRLHRGSRFVGGRGGGREESGVNGVRAIEQSLRSR